MLSDLYTYFEILWDKYSTLRGLAVPAIIVALGVAVVRAIKQFAGPYASRASEAGRVLFVGTTVFAIGFMAWRDEHEARVKDDKELADLRAAQNQSALAGNRLILGLISGSNCSDTCIFDLPIKNLGSTPIVLRAGSFDTKTSRELLSSTDIKRKFAEQKAWASQRGKSSEGSYYLGANQQISPKFDAKFKEGEKELFDKDNLLIYFVTTLVYSNAQTVAKQAILENNCFYIRKDTSYTYPCGVIERPSIINVDE